MKSVLSQDTVDLMRRNSLLYPHFRPVFGCRGVPIHYYTNLPQSDLRLKEALWEIVQKHDLLTTEMRQEYHSFLMKTGLVSEEKLPYTLNGYCVKKCKAVENKWACQGCGKLWLPGSYNSKTCKKYPDPFWLDPLKSTVDDWIQENGGVSDKSPLVVQEKSILRLFNPTSQTDMNQET